MKKNFVHALKILFWLSIVTCCFGCALWDEKKEAIVIFKAVGYRFVYQDQGLENSDISLRWCLVGSKNCAEHFDSYHYNEPSRPSAYFGDSDKTDDIFVESQYHPQLAYHVKPGAYYLGSIIEIKNYDETWMSGDEKTKHNYLRMRHDLISQKDDMLRQHINHTLPMIKDSELAKILTLPYDLFENDNVVSFAIKSALSPLAIAGASINLIQSKDLTYIKNFKSIDGWNNITGEPRFISFYARPNELIYLGDMEFFFIARGGSGAARRDGMVYVAIEDHVNEVIINFRKRYDMDNLIVRFPVLWDGIGRYGVGSF